MQYYLIPIYILFGVLPSLVWLFYYLKKDLHPEPKKMILKVFLLGGLITIPVYVLEVTMLGIIGQSQHLSFFALHPLLLKILEWFFAIALMEELAKYFVVRISVFNGPALDEPLDIMLYMVVAALGFAAVENILYLFAPTGGLSLAAILQTTLLATFIRFIGATLLHTLCSATIGYFWALSSLRNKNKVLLTVMGICLAVFLHGLYNFSITTLAIPYSIIIPASILVALVVFMLYDFNEIKKVKSICKL